MLNFEVQEKLNIHIRYEVTINTNFIQTFVCRYPN